MNPDEITRENLGQIDIKKIALNKERFGSLTFENVIGQLEKMQGLFVELEDLGYRDELSQPEVNDIDSKAERFITYIKQLASFNLSTGFNNSQHEQFIANINQIYDDTFKSLRDKLVYLRQEASLRSQDRGELAKQQKAAVQAEKEYKILADKFKKDLEVLEDRKSEIESKRGEIAATTFGKHFESQANTHKKNAASWLKIRNNYFNGLGFVIITNFIIYIVLFITHKLTVWPNLDPSEFFSLAYGLVNFALLSLFTYAISFSSKNYNVHSNLKIVNLHRKNVAETISDFLSSNNTNDDLRSKILDRGVDAMFKHLPIGYLPKVEAGDSGIFSSLLNTILKK